MRGPVKLPKEKISRKERKRRGLSNGSFNVSITTWKLTLQYLHILNIFSFCEMWQIQLIATFISLHITLDGCIQWVRWCASEWLYEISMPGSPARHRWWNNEKRVIDSPLSKWRSLFVCLRLCQCLQMHPKAAVQSSNPLRLDGRMCDKVVCRSERRTSHLMKEYAPKVHLQLANRPNNWLIRVIQ